MEFMWLIKEIGFYYNQNKLKIWFLFIWKFDKFAKKSEAKLKRNIFNKVAIYVSEWCVFVCEESIIMEMVIHATILNTLIKNWGIYVFLVLDKSIITFLFMILKLTVFLQT